MLSALLTALALAQSLQARAELVPAGARVGEPVVLRITAQARVRPDIGAPNLPDGLTIVGTSESTSTEIGLPGGRSVTFAREYVLLPARTGTFPIPPVRVEAGQESTFTGRLTLSVAHGAAAPAAGDALLYARLQPDTVYVGQQSTLVGEVLVTPDLQMRLARPPTYEMPSPSEFWIQELQAESQADAVVRAGQRYNVQRFARAYFPLTAGKFSFAPIRVTYEARQGFVFAPQTMELRSESPRLVVLPLPNEGRPESFRGAVGRYHLSSILDAREATVGDGVTLTLLVQGTGNVKALPPPVLPSIDNVSVLDPSELTDIQPSGRVVQGSKRFTWVLVPERPGTIEIPPIIYTYFDPIARKYVTEQTSRLSFVAAAAAADATVRTGSLLRGRPGRDPLGFVRTPAFAALQILPALLVLGAWLARRRPAGPSRRIQREWTYRAERLQERADFAAAADRLLRDALHAFSPQVVFHAGAVPEVERALQSLLPAELAADAVALLQRFSDARYSNTPLSDSERDSLQGRLRSLLDRLWQQMRSSTRAAGVPLLLLVALQEPPDQVFQRALAAYEQRDFAAAVAGFDRYTSLAPADANGWYNLGIARQAAQRPAAGAWALLRAARIEPRTIEITDQLRRAGVEPLARRVRPVTLLTPSGTLLVLSALWWLSCILIAAALWFRRNRIGWFALLPLLAAGVLATVTLVERVLPPAGIVLDQAANLYVGQSLHAETLRQLQPLAGVSIVQESEGWLKVRTADGDVGWVRRELIGRL